MAKTDSALFLSLLAHPDFPSEAVRHVAARAELIAPDSLRFQYVLAADLPHIRIPAPVAGAGRADKLWAHTCFEAFVGLARSQRYLELNFSPSGEWAAYRFDSYRQGMAPALDAAPQLSLRRSDDRLELHAQVHLSGAIFASGPPSEASGASPLRVALSTVVEDREGGLSYWALRHPSGRPDFHHPESFSLALELPRHPRNSP